MPSVPLIEFAEVSAIFADFVYTPQEYQLGGYILLLAQQFAERQGADWSVRWVRCIPQPDFDSVEYAVSWRVETETSPRRFNFSTRLDRERIADVFEWVTEKLVADFASLQPGPVPAEENL